MAFLFGYCWSVLRPIAFELNRRFVDAGTLREADDVFFLRTAELEQAMTGEIMLLRPRSRSTEITLSSQALGGVRFLS